MLKLQPRFASLPKPKETDWELELPEEQQEQISKEPEMEEDAAERDRRNNEHRLAAERAHFKRQTQAVQKALPRPSVVDVDSLLKNAAKVPDPSERLVAQEMAILVANDAVKYPVGGAKVHGTSKPLEQFSEDALNTARMEIALEQPDQSAADAEREFQHVWEEVHNSGKLPGLAGYGEDEVDEHQLMMEAFDVGVTRTITASPARLTDDAIEYSGVPYE